MRSEVCGDVDSLELGDTVEYTLSKGKGNKVSAEKVTKMAPGKERSELVALFLPAWALSHNHTCALHSLPSLVLCFTHL